MRKSLKDIAENLKLSQTTVSWVLSGKGDEKGISAATQEKVLKCAKQMNYQPNLLARSLNTGASGTIGLIIPDITDSFYSQIAKEIEMEAEKRGYTLMICSSESKIERESKMIRLFKAKQVDGIILAPTKRSRVEIEQLINESYPLVLFDRYFPELKTNYIIINNEGSSYELVKRMINNGAKKIVIVTTNSHLLTMNMRYEGYVRALLEERINIDPTLKAEIPFVGYKENITPILDNILKENPDVDGFFFTTHILALEAFLYFHNKGIDINNDIESACIHDLPSFRILAPKMHIARMPIEEIGKNAIRILINDIEARQKKSPQKSNTETLSIPCILV